MQNGMPIGSAVFTQRTVECHENIAGVILRTLVSVSFF